MNSQFLYFLLISLLRLGLAAPTAGQPPRKMAPPPYDVVVVGATVPGIAAAINAARYGHRVALTDHTDRIGGLVTGGLSCTDFKSLESVQGTFRDFMNRVESHYVRVYGAGSRQVTDCRFGAYAEPHVALKILHEMLAEHPGIHVFKKHQLDSAVMGTRSGGLAFIQAARFTDLTSAKPVVLAGRYFIDATYEGDLAAYADAACRVGRESRWAFGERFAGKLYFNDGKILPGSTGQGDSLIQGYNFRPTMTQRPDNRVLIEKPARYQREAYTYLLPYFKSGKIKKIFTTNREGILRVQPLPNDKADINDIKNAPFRLCLFGQNTAYPNGTWNVRKAIEQQHREHVLGVLYFLQNDPEMPETHLAEARSWGLAKDEFEDNNHFPARLYVREARRIVGEYTFQEHDTQMAPESVRTPVQTTSVGVGDYALNCHGEHGPGPLHVGITEGDFAYAVTPFQIPYGVMLPKGFANLLVPVAVSASHIGFSALRLEPTWTALGQAAGLAAHIALVKKCPVNVVPVQMVQKLLHDQGAITVYFSDVPPTSPHFKAVQYFGTRGFFHDLVDLNGIDFKPPANLGYGQFTEAFPYHEAKLNEPLSTEVFGAWCRKITDEKLRGRVLARRAVYVDGKSSRGQFLHDLFGLHDQSVVTKK